MNAVKSKCDWFLPVFDVPTALLLFESVSHKNIHKTPAGSQIVVVVFTF